MRISDVAIVAGVHDASAVRILTGQVDRHLPHARATVLALPGAALALGAVGVSPIAVGDLGDLHLESVAGRVGERALATLARPLLVRHLLGSGAGAVLLLAPDAELRAHPAELEAALDGAPVVLVERVGGPLPDDELRPDARDLLAAGEVDDELVAVAGDDPAGARLVEWWAQRAAEALRVSRDAAGGDGDERPAPSPLSVALEGAARLEHPGYGVSFWNLHERPLAEVALRVVRFEGFRPDRPWWLSEHGDRVRVLDDDALAALCRERARSLVDAGWEAPTGHRRLAGTLPLDARMRRLLGEAHDAGEPIADVDTPAGVEALSSWLAGGAPAGAAHGVTRYAHAVWRERAELQRAYPDLDDGADAEGLAGWLWVHGVGNLDLVPGLLPPAPDWLEHAPPAPPSGVVAGYLRATLGLGEAARAYVRALRAAGADVGTRSIPIDGPLDDRGEAKRRVDEVAFDDVDPEAPADAVIVCVNAPQLPETLDLLGPEAVAGKRIIGVWGWEADVVPPEWRAGFELVDEIWVYSTYVADVFARLSPVPVVTVPLPVTAPREIASDVDVAWPDADFTFLFAFDFLSTLQRKNPVGLIRAFRRAFAPGEGPALVLKTTNARFRPREHDRLRHEIGDRTDITIVDASLPAPAVAALFARADCYVSLHRSEGFGLTVAEAMAIGKPVIATGHGGNTDFMSHANSYLVDFEVTRVGAEAEHYPADATWAEPSIEHAADLLRAVVADRDGATRRGARAAADVAARLAPEVVGAIARGRLELARDLAGAGTPVAPVDASLLGDIDERLGFDVFSTGGATGAKGRARDTALRTLAPYLDAERALDASTVAALHRVAGELGQLRAARERDRRRIARLERLLGRGG